MKYTYWLCALPFSNSKKIRLCYDFITPAGAYWATEDELRSLPYLTDENVRAILDSKNKKILIEDYVRQAKKGIGLCPFTDQMYPSRLKDIPDPPFCLFYKGHLPREEGLKVAIVGARMCSPYGQMMSEKLGEALGRVGADVISGMAKGVDSASHRGALVADGATYAVMGCGVDICYPRENQRLYDRIQEKGGIISEYLPGTEALPAYFPQRNRIISGLADIVIIIEARKKSGSLITADFALEQGRDIYCLPGRCTDVLSYGTNNLIRQGAGIIVSIEQLMEDLSLLAKDTRAPHTMPPELSREEMAVYKCLDDTPRDISLLISNSKLTMTEVFSAITSLREKGLASEAFMNTYVRSL